MPIQHLTVLSPSNGQAGGENGCSSLLQFVTSFGLTLDIGVAKHASLGAIKRAHAYISTVSAAACQLPRFFSRQGEVVS